MTSTECHDVAVSGPLPGLSLQENPYKSTQVKLAEGHKLLLATDGFYDAFNNEKGQRTELLPCLYDVLQLPAADMAAHLWMEFGTRLEKKDGIKDDATLVIMQYGG